MYRPENKYPRKQEIVYVAKIKASTACWTKCNKILNKISFNLLLERHCSLPMETYPHCNVRCKNCPMNNKWGRSDVSKNDQLSFKC